MSIVRTVNMIAAERRRRIYEQAVECGAVSVSELVKDLGVTENTIRHDLNILHEEGKLVRSHGGAIVDKHSIPAAPYSQTRGTHLEEKQAIALAAMRFVPDAGSVCINAGSTNHQLALQISRQAQLHIATNSPEIALHLALNTESQVDMLGGRVIPESAETDASFSMELMESLFWDVSFVGLSALDLRHGITSLNLNTAHFEHIVMEHSRKVIGLCDSSKLGRFSHARVGPVILVDVLVTDSGADEHILDALRVQEIEVVVAEVRQD